MPKLRSYRNRAFHMGPFPPEKLDRAESVILRDCRVQGEMTFRWPNDPTRIVNTMDDQ